MLLVTLPHPVNCLLKFGGFLFMAVVFIHGLNCLLKFVIFSGGLNCLLNFWEFYSWAQCTKFCSLSDIDHCCLLTLLQICHLNLRDRLGASE